jgi:hypothetical protein
MDGVDDPSAGMLFSQVRCNYPFTMCLVLFHQHTQSLDRNCVLTASLLLSLFSHPPPCQPFCMRCLGLHGSFFAWMPGFAWFCMRCQVLHGTWIHVSRFPALLHALLIGVLQFIMLGQSFFVSFSSAPPTICFGGCIGGIIYQIPGGYPSSLPDRRSLDSAWGVCR